MTVRLTVDTITPSIQRMRAALQALPQAATDVWIKNTPVRTGNARSRTGLRQNRDIVADYPYAQRLDQGWSRQSPQGMSRPTQRFIDQQMRKIMRL